MCSPNINLGMLQNFGSPTSQTPLKMGSLCRKHHIVLKKNNKPMWPMLSTSPEVVSAVFQMKVNLKALQLWLNHQAWCIRSEFPRTVTCLETVPPRRWFWAKLSSYVATGTWNLSPCFAWHTHLSIYTCHLVIPFIYLYMYISRVYSVSNFNSQPMVGSWTRFVEEPALGNTLSIGWMLGRSKVLGYKLNQHAIPLTDAATTLWMKKRRRLKVLHHTCLEKMILWKKIKAQWTWYHIKLV